MAILTSNHESANSQFGPIREISLTSTDANESNTRNAILLRVALGTGVGVALGVLGAVVAHNDPAVTEGISKLLHLVPQYVDPSHIARR